MNKLCEGLNTLSRSDARRLYDDRVRQQTHPKQLSNDSQVSIEMQDSDWLDNLETEFWERMFGGPDDDSFEH